MIKNIILDLDNTLIDAKLCSLFHDFDKDLLNKLSFVDTQIGELMMRVFFRPGLLNFLQFCCENFNVSVWSAGLPEYVKAIVDLLFVKNNLRYNLVLNAEDLDECKYTLKINFKDLRYLKNKYGLNLSETILIDDFMGGKLIPDLKLDDQNVYIIKPFYTVRYVSLSSQVMLKNSEIIIKPGFEYNIDAHLDNELEKCCEELIKYLNK